MQLDCDRLPAPSLHLALNLLSLLLDPRSLAHPSTLTRRLEDEIDVHTTNKLTGSEVTRVQVDEHAVELLPLPKVLTINEPNFDCLLHLPAEPISKFVFASF
jgi:hypothetical protein